MGPQGLFYHHLRPAASFHHLSISVSSLHISTTPLLCPITIPLCFSFHHSIHILLPSGGGCIFGGWTEGQYTVSTAKPSSPGHLLCASWIGSSTNTLHSLLAILSSEMRVWSGGRYGLLPAGGPTGGVMALHSITLPDLTWCDLDGCRWEKLCDRPRLCLSSSSLAVGLDDDDGEFLSGDLGSTGGVDIEAVNWSFSFMCWLSSKSPVLRIWKATVKEMVEPFLHCPRLLRGDWHTTAPTL